jgi:hypothetical protein
MITETWLARIAVAAGGVIVALVPDAVGFTVMGTSFETLRNTVQT